jgi:hypothetical protein
VSTRQLEALVIGHCQRGDAADHAENGSEQRALVREQQGYPHQEGSGAAEGRKGEPVPAHAPHNRRCLLKIDDD